ncbi:hypothetical protein KMW28_08510 [Flammeovirga yaeyamensis]|uniref:Uncharacterized protein n=1 Tax=Flammeovirga yaeyamensis TaxID=367791 RepID=A0AAX1N7R2_9BACT|nr:hypothetical protein [Flammeovirga yaeyamensis]MBB3698997.1 hypothetical protein [Flammeovirga yaeyamensis]NMF36431.1 hypothetical protein [Flammeovirga yaeyamensis]QWG03609.1 hypothetical protein KMW28_08510 [Flammeovirga yaeyamensis]
MINIVAVLSLFVSVIYIFITFEDEDVSTDNINKLKCYIQSDYDSINQIEYDSIFLFKIYKGEFIYERTFIENILYKDTIIKKGDTIFYQIYFGAQKSEFLESFYFGLNKTYNYDSLIVSEQSNCGRYNLVFEYNKGKLSQILEFDSGTDMYKLIEEFKNK